MNDGADRHEPRGDNSGPVTRTLQLLKALAEAEGPTTLTELARRLGLPTSTTHRFLLHLRDQNFVEYDATSRRYQPGWEFYRTGALVTLRRPLAEMALPLLKNITQLCNENSQLGIYQPDQESMMFVVQAQSSHPLRFSIPMFNPQPLLWGCSGRVIVAHLPEPTVDFLLKTAQASPATGAAPPEAKPFRQELARIREQGWDTTAGEKIPNSVGFAAPVFDAHSVIASISITIPSMRYHSYDKQRFVDLVVNAAAQLSESLGHLPAAV